MLRLAHGGDDIRRLSPSNGADRRTALDAPAPARGRAGLRRHRLPARGRRPTRCARAPAPRCSEMGGADPDAQVALTDFLLGQADPIGRADAVRHLQNDPDANALASACVAQLRLLAPQAELPEIPAPRGGRAPRPAPAPRRPPPRRAALPPQRPRPRPPPASARLGRAGARSSAGSRGAFKGIGSSKRSSQLIVGDRRAGGSCSSSAVLAIAGVFGGDDDGGSDEPTTTARRPTRTSRSSSSRRSSGDSGATGQAVFAQAQRPAPAPDQPQRARAGRQGPDLHRLALQLGPRSPSRSPATRSARTAT